ncbi:MAG: cobalamin-dependent protein [Spirochaetes bacterium]|nr:cobalamin-dependent protein [Spirochaetota bacterium]
MISKTATSAGSKSNILLTSVFGPFAQDDEYGSRKINPMELFHNQVTRVQGPFSLRMFHPSHGLMMIKENISAPCTLLDFPTLDRFIEELATRRYDIIGISSIIPNVGKVKKMCELIREYQPAATIVVGGHIANLPDINDRIDADHVVRGEGVSWFRKFLGEDGTAAIKHPISVSGFGARILGIPLRTRPGDVAAIVIPSVGCPMGCNFCATSHLFGGKGKSINFFETGDELYSVMCNIEKKLKVRSFFIMDENFLLNKKRSLRLLDLMKENNKIWSLSIFSSARVIKSYTDEQLTRLGVAWIWMGLEGENSSYKKLESIDTKALVKHLQSLGIRVLGSTIIGLETHTPENVDKAIDWAVSHNTVFHQFMLYTPIPGTPLYEKHKNDGTLIPEEECSLADSHGQHRFNFRHPFITGQSETNILLSAFQRDFKTNGPSLLRLIRTMLEGWKNLKNSPDPCVRNRAKWEYKNIKSAYAAAVKAMTIWYRDDRHMYKTASDLLKDLYNEFGWRTRLTAEIGGPGVYLLMKREAKKLASGWRYEPSTTYEKNTAAWALEQSEKDYAGKVKKIIQEVQIKDLAPALNIMDTNYSD